MRGFLLLLGRELRATFHSFGFFVLLAVVAAVTAFAFQSALAQRGFEMNHALSDIYSWLFYLTLLVTPLLTMRLFAEEKRSGSFELLMTAPVSDVQVVAAKYAGAVVVFGVFMLPVWVCNLVLALFFDSAPDWGQITSVSLGLFDLGLVYLAVGTLCSAVASMQLWAGLLAFVGNTVLWLIGSLRGLLPDDTLLHRLFTYVNLEMHLASSAAGLLDLRHVVYQLSLAFLLLFWTVRLVEARKWR